MKVYIVTSGTYSDYHIDAVFDNEETAQNWCVLHLPDDGKIEVFDTQEHKTNGIAPVVFKKWHVYVDTNGVFALSAPTFTSKPCFVVKSSTEIIATTSRYTDDKTAKKIIWDKLAEWKYEHET